MPHEIKIDLTALNCKVSSLGLGADKVFVIVVVIDTGNHSIIGQEQHEVGNFNSGQSLQTAQTIFDNKTLPALPDNFAWSIIVFNKSIIGFSDKKLQEIVDEAQRRVAAITNIAKGWVPGIAPRSKLILLIGEIIDLIEDILALFSTKVLGVISGTTKEVDGKPIVFKISNPNRFDFSLDGWFSEYTGSYAVWAA